LYNSGEFIFLQGTSFKYILTPWTVLISHAEFRVFLQEEWELWQHVKGGLKIVLSTRIRRHQENSALKQNSSCAEERCVYQFVLLDWYEELINTTTSNMVVARWRPLLQIEASNRHSTNRTTTGSPFLLMPLVPLLNDWARIKEEGVTCDLGDDDTCVDSHQTGESLRMCRLTLGLLRSDRPILTALPFLTLGQKQDNTANIKKENPTRRAIIEFILEVTLRFDCRNDSFFIPCKFFCANSM
jgi:hypothetical protein